MKFWNGSLEKTGSSQSCRRKSGGGGDSLSQGESLPS